MGLGAVGIDNEISWVALQVVHGQWQVDIYVTLMKKLANVSNFLSESSLVFFCVVYFLFKFFFFYYRVDNLVPSVAFVSVVAAWVPWRGKSWLMGSAKHSANLADSSIQFHDVRSVASSECLCLWQLFHPVSICCSLWERCIQQRWLSEKYSLLALLLYR